MPHEGTAVSYGSTSTLKQPFVDAAERFVLHCGSIPAMPVAIGFQFSCVRMEQVFPITAFLTVGGSLACLAAHAPGPNDQIRISFSSWPAPACRFHAEGIGLTSDHLFGERIEFYSPSVVYYSGV
jgi:hypothetical protein